jgi:hypothetical protein
MQLALRVTSQITIKYGPENVLEFKIKTMDEKFIYYPQLFLETQKDCRTCTV